MIRKFLANSSPGFWETLALPYLLGLFPLFLTPALIFSLAIPFFQKLGFLCLSTGVIITYVEFGFFSVDMASEHGRPCFFRIGDILRSDCYSEMWIVTEKWGQSYCGRPINSKDASVLLNPSDWKIM